jgi:hypothetical protein
MRASPKLQLIVAKIVGILLINAVCIDRAIHRNAVVCESFTVSNSRDSTFEREELLQQDLPGTESKASYEPDSNRREPETESKADSVLIRENHGTFNERTLLRGDPQRTPTHLNPRRTSSLSDPIGSKINGEPIIDNDSDDEGNDYDVHDPTSRETADRSSEILNNGKSDRDSVHRFIDRLGDEVAIDSRDYRQHMPHLSVSHQDIVRLSSQWCQVNDQLDGYCRRLKSQNYSDAIRVCGSDGRYHTTICDFKRHSCRYNNDGYDFFHVKPHSYCTTVASKFEFSCSKSEYLQFKVALLNEFNGDVGLMFKYLDANHNDILEARELWPKLNIDDHEHQTRICDDCYQSSNVDFAFKPYFNWSPCSLSHLLVHENSHNLSREMFSQIFTQSTNTSYDSNRIVENSSTKTFYSRILLNMGESKAINCLPDHEQSAFGSEETDCVWTRYGLNLGTIRDDHVLLERSYVSRMSKKSRESLQLHLKDAQLYLSGPYRCFCSADQDSKSNQSRALQHDVYVQVLGEFTVPLSI